MAKGPLEGIKVVDTGGIGPSTFAAMVLGDLGADVIRFDRLESVESSARRPDFLLTRNQRSIAIDLRSDAGRELVLELIRRADVVIEGFRPGVAERLGIGPDDCGDERLVYARVTGWGQDGPWAQGPGHDINYIAVTGVLHAIGRKGAPPPPPLNVIGDYGGGGMVCLLGILAALLERHRSGRGQVVDAAMVDGVALLSTLFHGMRHIEFLDPQREANTVDGGAPWYDSYVCADGRYISVGAGEPQFYTALCELLAIGDRFDQMDKSQWPQMRETFAERFATRTRDEWASLAGDPKLCLAPVLTWDEAPDNEHLAARGTYSTFDGIVQPSSAPRFSRTPGTIARQPPWPGEHTDEILSDWKVPVDKVAAAEGAVRQRVTGSASSAP
jgi:alpha-methylacyl-CoA racemase